ncbi:VanW family protein [Rossellomorea aquimaris]|uniref:VanW family protein n=1 Tax=Rossellomorea aquimaris TaxID=189382 RepID=UPI0007D080A8|nr:VanW family protein [Rossellomorea aquimaris]
MLWLKLGFLCLLSIPTLKSSSDQLHILLDEENIISVEKKDLMIELVDIPILHHDQVESLTSEISHQVYTPPKNAYIDDRNQIKSEVVGYKLHHHKFMEHLNDFFYSKGSKVVKVPLLMVYPQVDSELLANISTVKIGQYRTYFNNHNEERSQNIELATKKINNTVVFPGEVFSFNKVVGKRTKAKGYMKAPVIVKGELSEDIGGGICQVSSTLYNAVDHAGVEIVELYHHSKGVHYVPKGRDATVSWYGPDFTFRNSYNQPLLIRGRVLGGQVLISIYSSDFLEYKNRQVPMASSDLPEESPIEDHVNHPIRD